MENLMQKEKANHQDEKRNAAKKMLPYPPKENEQELYLEHLMRMMVNVLDRGFQKG